MVGPYRSSRADEALHGQLKSEISTLEASFTEAFWERVAAVWGIDRDQDGEDRSLTQARRRVHQLREALQRARSNWGREAILPPLDQAVSSDEPSSMMRKFFSQAYGTRPDMREIEISKGTAKGWWVLRAHIGQTPIELSVQVVHGGQSRGEKPASGDGTLEEEVDRLLRDFSHGAFDLHFREHRFCTTVAPAARLTISPEGVWEDIRKLLGISDDLRIGDPRFDPAFVIYGDHPSARALLTGDVCYELQRANIEGHPVAHVRDGVAEITGVRNAGVRAVRILAAWHRAPSPFPLLTSEGNHPSS